MIGPILATLAGLALPVQTLPREPDRTWLKTIAKPAKNGRTNHGGTPVKNLPHANGREFATLDAYLGYLRDHAAPMDLPWFREMRPGVFRRESNLRNGAAPQEFTRAELMRRFGFTE